MQKKPLQDVIPPREHSARNRRPVAQSAPRQEPPIPPPSTPKQRMPRRRGPRWRIWLVVILAIAILGVGVSFFFSGTKLVVHPKNRSVAVDVTLEAFRVPEPGQLGYEIMTLEKTASRSVAATGEEEVETRASGTIVIYNDHSSADQRLIKNTRFETPEGLIYRIPEAVVVPGQQTEGGESVPGSIEVEVFADEPGEEYNIGLTDFTIPGFSGSPRFETFYARSKTPMTGGFDGVRRQVAQGDRERTVAELRRELRDQLLSEAFAQKPNGFLLYEDALFVTFESLPDEAGSEGTATIRERGTLYGVLFGEPAFAAFLASNTIAGYDGEPVILEDPASVSVSILEKEAARPWEDESVSFSVDGRARIIWTFDEERLRRDVAGIDKEALPTVLSGYPSIERAEALLRPFWRGSFPEEPSEITIVKNLDD